MLDLCAFLFDSTNLLVALLAELAAALPDPGLLSEGAAKANEADDGKEDSDCAKEVKDDVSDISVGPSTLGEYVRVYRDEEDSLT